MKAKLFKLCSECGYTYDIESLTTGSDGSLYIDAFKDGKPSVLSVRPNDDMLYLGVDDHRTRLDSQSVNNNKG